MGKARDRPIAYFDMLPVRGRSGQNACSRDARQPLLAPYLRPENRFLQRIHQARVALIKGPGRPSLVFLLRFLVFAISMIPSHWYEDSARHDAIKRSRAATGIRWSGSFRQFEATVFQMCVGGSAMRRPARPGTSLAAPKLAGHRPSSVRRIEIYNPPELS